mmetsp:Transcript_109248/g.216982  ORF Transcript_109248/g.216982 Transcript_109248/m.216982 type:complete len:356 (+) Transcript_109248:17-1084(+)
MEAQSPRLTRAFCVSPISHRTLVVTAHGALLFATITFSAWNVLAGSFGTSFAHVAILCAVRDGTALVLLCACRVLSERSCQASQRPGSNTGRPVGSRDWLLLATVGISAPFLAALATVCCAMLAGSDTVGILNAVGPAIASLLAVGVGLERASWCLTAGVLLGSAGGCVTVKGASSAGSGSERSSTQLMGGIIAGIVMALAQGIFFVAMKPLLRQTNARKGIPALVVISTGYAFASFASVSCCLGLAIFKGTQWLVDDWGSRQTFMAVYAGLICAGLNYFLLTWANKVLPVTICAVYGALQPPCTAVMAFLARGEALTTAGYLSMFLVVASVVIISWERSEAEPLHTGQREELLT